MVVLGPLAALAQPVAPGDGPRFPGTMGEPAPYDTANLRAAKERTAEAVSLLETAIDPATYMLGPGDQLSIAIPGIEGRVLDLAVAPDAKLVVPRVGAIDLRGRTLAEGEKLIRDAVGRVYRSGDAAISLRKIRQFKVSLIGAVLRPGTVTATPATRVSEVIDAGGGANPTASKRNITVRRGARTIDVDLLPFYAYGDLASNPIVEGGDVIQVGVQDKKSVVGVFGGVQRPGEFSFRNGDSVSSLIRYSWGFTADAVPDSILVVSVNDNGDTLDRQVLNASWDGRVENDRALRRGDRVFVRRNANYLTTTQAVVAGEVRYPGAFPIESGRTRLLDLIQGSGGFTEDASVPDALLIRRKAILERDTKYELILQIDPEKRTPEDISYLRIKQTERPGVMTVNIAQLLAGRESENITLIDQDSLYVPSKKDFIKVTGKVKSPGNVAFKPGAGYEHYLGIAGGYGWKADEGETRIIKGKSGDTFLASSESNYDLEPGDQIFVPEEAESAFWEGFTTAITVLAQIGTIVAVILSVRSSVQSPN